MKDDEPVIVAGVSTNLFEYDGLDLVSETQNGVVIARTNDTLGRAAGFSVAGVGAPGQPYSVTYGYDDFGRFAQVSNFQFQVSYSYLSGSSLVSGMTASSGHSWSRSYEPERSLITAVENKYGPAIISRFDYENDAIGRRISRVDSGTAFDNPAFDKYSYNERSEVIGAQRYHGTDVSNTSQPYGGRGFGYNYDTIGNRTSASETIGGESLVKSYTANALNQYTAIANPDAVGLRGSATNTATVTVNGNAALSDNVASDTVPWHFALQADNANEGKYTFASIVGVVNPPGTNTPDIVSTASGSIYSPPQQETLAYDLDGNLLSDGRWHYTWNGENRLVKAEELASPTNRLPHVVEYAYDHRGRMIWKTVASSDTPQSKAIRYLWDDFNIIAETVAQDTATNTNYNIWGLDLDGTLQGAGGVGGLLAVVKDSATYIPAFDANGNIMEYVSADGTIAAHREYDPFGAAVVATGDIETFTHWFSTKPWCEVTGLSEYQYRKYSPVLGRWMNRDPIGEDTENPLYVFCNNDAISHCDLVGELTWFASGALSVAMGLGVSLLTHTPYDVNDAIIDFGLGALGPGVVSGGKKLYNAAKCFKFSANINSKIVRIAREVHKIDDLGEIYGVATRVQEQRKLSIAWRIAGEGFADEGKVIFVDAVSVTVAKKLLHGVNHASFSVESNASYELEVDENGNVFETYSETPPTYENDNWDNEHIHASPLN